MLTPGHRSQSFTVWCLPRPPAETVRYEDGREARLVWAEVRTMKPTDRERFKSCPEFRDAWRDDIDAGGGFDLVAVKPNRRLPCVVWADWPHYPLPNFVWADWPHYPWGRDERMVPSERLASEPYLPPWGVLVDGVVHRWRSIVLDRRLTPPDYAHIASLCRCGKWFHWPVGSVHHVYFEDKRDLVAARLLLSG